MAIADPYADAATYKLGIVKSSDSDDAAILSSLNATSRWMEKKLGVVTFNQTASAVAIEYLIEADGNGHAQQVLPVRPIASITGLEVIVDTDADGSYADETALVLGTDYELLPYGAIDATLLPEAEPYTKLRLLGLGSVSSVWPVGNKVRVTAVFGYPVIPEGIVNACIQFTAMWRGESPYFTQQVQSLDEVEAMSPQARSTLKGLLLVNSPTAGIGIG